MIIQLIDFKKIEEKINDEIHYNITQDIADTYYNNCWLLSVVGGRRTGKTFSTLLFMLEANKFFVFLKRTNEDVNLICQNSKDRKDLEFSPFLSINEKFDKHISASQIADGVGLFYDEESDRAVGCVISFSKISKFKGFGMPKAYFCIFDEFIPNIYERVLSQEGYGLLDLYMTLSDGREIEGEPPLIMILLANSTRIWNPIFNTLDIIDTIVEMKRKKQTSLITRNMNIRLLDDQDKFKDKMANTSIMQSMSNTDWGRMALDNEFGYDDFSKIGHTSLKGYVCQYGFTYQNKTYYVYAKGVKFYVCRSAQDVPLYNLNEDADKRDFYYAHVCDLELWTTKGNVLYSDYVAYQIIMFYKKSLKW